MREENLVQGAIDRLTGRKPIETPPAPRSSADWLAAWRQLADATDGITGNDPRFEPVMRWLDVCDTAYLMESWPTFCEAAEEVKRIAKGK